ncbi:MAG TPA: cupin domain-containing protein [Candidatus Binatia bacterium]|nr:cupin domain-containing protein [Candidatus Binatia bacterium]
MEITDGDGIWAHPGDERHFSGRVWMAELAAAGAPGACEVMSVHFAPGARTAWHSHPEGQLLHVTAGSGMVKSAEGEPREIRAGYTVRAAPGERHWHGATAGHPMTHLAIQPTGTEWFEHVTEAEYREAGERARSRG